MSKQHYSVRIGTAALATITLAILAVGCAKPDEQDPNAKTSSKQETPSVTTPPEQKVAENGPASKDPAQDSPSKTSLIDKAKQTISKPLPTNAIKPVPAGSNGYVPEERSALEIAKDAEAHIASLSGVVGEYSAALEFGGGHGTSMGYMSVKGPKAYRADYVSLVPGTLNAFIRRETLVVAGNKTATLNGDSSWSTASDISTYVAEAKKPVEKWAETFPRTIFSSLSGGQPISDLVANAVKEGLVVKTERHLTGNASKTVLQRRIIISRKPADAAKLGALDIEVVVDGKFHLPVTVRTNYEPPKKDPVRIMWTSRWAKMQTGQKFDQNAFVIPKPTIKA
ncbi:hypothetical protein BH11ARM1_BH11ARM1_08460 [soil metagenome]